jgi:molybdopterin molybdotransferase
MSDLGVTPDAAQSGARPQAPSLHTMIARAQTLHDVWSAIDRAVPGPTQTERVQLRAGRGRICAKTLRSPTDIPRFNQAAMDGYGLDAASLSMGVETCEPVVGVCRPGRLPVMTGGQGVVKVATGAALPGWVSAVVRWEDCVTAEGQVHLSGPVHSGLNVRMRGEDALKGRPVIPSGRRIDARSSALAAAAGARGVDVWVRPRAGILITGDEVAPPGAKLSGAQIHDSNGVMAAQLLEAEGVDVRTIRYVPDDQAQIEAALEGMSESCDLIVLSGGMSHSDQDATRLAVPSLGGWLSSLPLKLRPGKPSAIGAFRKSMLVGMPGNPLAAYVAMQIIGLPIARRLCGLSFVTPTRRPVEAGFDLKRAQPTIEFVPARIGECLDGSQHAKILSRGASARLVPLAESDGLLCFDAEQMQIDTSDHVDFWPHAN